jgi:glucose-1-phosphate cytidylyltransferase
MEEFKFDNFYLTYGDGVSNVDIDKLTRFHFENNTIGTVTAVNPPPRFGLLEIKENQVIKVREKNEIIPTWINGGYFVLNKDIYNYLSDHEALEDTPMMNLSNDGQLSAYKHYGYWQCVDTIRELEIFEGDLKNQKYIL